MKSKKPRYWDITIHIIDRPLYDEEYLSGNEIMKAIQRNLDLQAGIKVKNLRAKVTVKK